MAVFLVLALTALTAILGVLLVRAVRSYLRFRALELAIPGPRSLPLFGNLLDMAGVTEDGKLDALQAMWGARRGDISRMTLANFMLVFASDPDDIARVLKERRFAVKPFLFYGFMKPLVGHGLTVSNGDRWRAHRAWMQPAFHQDVLDRFVEVFREEAEALVAALPIGEVIPVLNRLREATARSGLRTGLSSDTVEEDKTTIDTLIAGVEPMLNIVNNRSFRPWLWPTAIFNLTSVGRRMGKYEALGKSFMGSVLSRKRSARAEEHQQQQRKTFIDIVLDTEAETKTRFTDADILDECRTLFATSTEITATALGFILKVLSIRPDVQDRVVAELRDVFPDGHAVGKEDLGRLEYMECVIKETLRLLPTIPFVARELTEDTEFNGKTVPAGAIFLVHILAAHRDPRHHPDPDRFDPERFRGESAGRMHPCSFMPFAGGPRTCIGLRYAMMQIKTILAVLLREHRVEPVDDGLTDPGSFPLTFDLALRIVGGTRVRFERR